MSQPFPEGKFMATIKLGPKGQIVIPKEVRDMFSLKEGDTLLFLADKSQGIAMQPFEYAQTIWQNFYRLTEKGEKK